MKNTLHIEGAGVDGSWLTAGISSIVSGILVTRCGGVHLRRYANGEKLKSDAPPTNLSKYSFNGNAERQKELGGDNPFSFPYCKPLDHTIPARPLDGRRESAG